MFCTLKYQNDSNGTLTCNGAKGILTTVNSTHLTAGGSKVAKIGYTKLHTVDLTI